MDDHLSELEPEGMLIDGQGWQQRKSVQTRVAVLQAAVDCLAQHGYARTTTQMIAKTARISRGAMLHHYATKQELIAAVIDYTCYKRMELFIGGINALTEEQRVVQSAGMELYWQSLLTPEYEAFLELSVAARTDEELRAVFLPKAQRFLKVERGKTLEAIPEWSDKVDLLQLASDFTVAAMQGLYLNRDLWDSRERRALLRKLISETVNGLWSGRISAPAPRRS